MLHISRALILLTILCLLPLRAHAQCQPQWLRGGQALGGVNGTVGAAVTLPNGDTIIGGFFNSAGSTLANNIACYHRATDTFTPLGSGITGSAASVYALALAPSGDVLVGGSFNNAGGVATSGIARYNPTTGVWSTLGAGVGATSIYAIATLPDGTVFAGGDGTIAGGRRIARFSPTTNLWSTMGAGVGLTGPAGGGNSVNALATTPSGELIVGGYFTTAGGVAANNFARYQPAANTWSAPGNGPAGVVFALTVIPNGDIYVGGSFTQPQFGGDIHNLVRFQTPGLTSWSAPGGSVNSVVSSLSYRMVGNEPEILVGGLFSRVGLAQDGSGGIDADHFAQLRPFTGAWTGAVQNGDLASTISITAIAPSPSGDEVVLGGNFIPTSDGSQFAGAARMNLSTLRWSPMGPNLINDNTNALVELPGGDVLVAGFRQNLPTDLRASGYITRFSPSTGISTPLAVAPNNPMNLTGWISAMATLGNGRVLVGGYFTTINGVASRSIALLDPATGACSAVSPLTYGTGIPDVICMLPLPDGDVIVGGAFSAAGGLAASNIARYHPATDTWSPLSNAGPDAYVNSLALSPNGDIVVGGYFIFVGDVISPNIALYHPDGHWSDLGLHELDSLVYAVNVLPNGVIVAGGSFNQAGGVSAHNIAWCNPANTTWHAFGSGANGQVNSIARTASNDLVVAGSFGSINDVASYYLIRFRFTTGQWAPFSASGGLSTLPGLEGQVVAAMPSGTIGVGGYFYAGPVVPFGSFALWSDPSAPQITSSPSSISRCSASPATFTVAATGAGNSIQWQAADQYGLWRTISSTPTTIPCPAGGSATATASPSGSTTTALSFTGCPTNTHWSIRALVTNSCGTAYSAAATLTLNSADFNGNGDIGTDQDIEAFFACLGGTCCPLCGSADFNGDGDIGTDADIEAFFRVLAGGAC